MDENFRFMCESYNITIKSTDAESPWSNGMWERHIAVWDDVLLKTVAEKRSSLGLLYTGLSMPWILWPTFMALHPISLTWGTPLNYPPFYTTNPLPSNLFLSMIFFYKHLNIMAAARKAYIEVESSQFIKRPL